MVDPLSIIALALVAGAAASAKDVAAQAVKDGYAGLKALVIRKFGGKGGGQAALEQVEQEPDSQPWQGALKDALSKASVDKDEDVLKQAEALVELLKQHDAPTVATYSAILLGDGAIAQGPGAVAAGKRGVAIGGSVSGGTIITGDSNVVGDKPEKKP